MAAALVSGCGARTGLRVPDVESNVDAATDAPTSREVCLEPGSMPDRPLVVDLATNARVAVADVLFVIDRTGSMDQEIDNIRSSLRTVIVPGLTRDIPDVQLGLASYADFPIDPYGGGDDLPFRLDQRMGSDYTALQGALGRLTADGGGDNPEAMIEALYQIATGDGLSGPSRAAIPPSPGCPGVAVGYACVRPRSTPILVVIADAPSHNGAPSSTAGGSPYNPAVFRPFDAPHTYEQTVTALRERLHARVVGINSGTAPFSARPDLEALATDTGSLGDDGRPLVFDINPDGSGLGEQVVRAVGRFTAEVRLNVSARATVVSGPGGDGLVRNVRPLRADPMDRVARIDETTFYSVVPGTRLQFGLELDRARAVRMAVEQRFIVRVEFLADGLPTLGFADVEVVIPAAGAPGCEQ